MATVSCRDSDRLLRGNGTKIVATPIASLTNYMPDNPDFTDPRAECVTRTVWELPDGRLLTNELRPEGCTHKLEPAPTSDDEEDGS